jgi:hypothetical protein
MVKFLSAMLAYLRAFVIARHTLALEAVALRQQHRSDRLFWVLLRQIWMNWSEALILVKPIQ